MAGRALEQAAGARQRGRVKSSLAAAALAAATLLASVISTAALRAEWRRAVGASAGASSEDAAAIRRVLEDQAAAWNRGDLNEFLQGYWQSDATAFAGAQGILRGWQALEARYRRSYPNREAMGMLTFSSLEVTPLCADAALVLGEWRLARAAGPVGGVFSLVLRRLPEGWRIIADHTSVAPVPAQTPGG